MRNSSSINVAYQAHCLVVHTIRSLLSNPMSKTARSDDVAASSGAGAGSVDTGAVDLKEKLSSNRMVYSFPPSLGVCKSRSLVRNNFPSQTYLGGTPMVIHLNSGEAFVNPETSYIVFQAGAVLATPLTNYTTTGIGSAANFFRTAILTSASGTEIERVELCNLVAVVNDRDSRMDQNYLQTNAVAAGYGPTNIDPSVIAGTTPVTAGSRGPAGQLASATALNQLPTFAVPLQSILGLFRAKKLIPSALLSGARLEIQLETPERALNWQGATMAATGYSIYNPFVVLDSYILEDSVLLALQKIAQSDGLDYTFTTVDVTQGTFTNQNDIEMDVRKAVSIANRVTVLRHPPPAATATEAALDSFNTSGNRFLEWQFNLGSLYMPNQRQSLPQPGFATAGTTDISVGLQNYAGLKEFYHNTLYAFEGYTPTGTSLTYQDYVYNLAQIGCTLERSTLLSLSGMPVASARQMHISAKMVPATVNNHVISVLLEYTVLCRCFLDRVIIRN